MDQNHIRGGMDQQQGIIGMASRGGIKAMDQNQGMDQRRHQMGMGINGMGSRGMASWPSMDKSGSSIKGILAMGIKGIIRASEAGWAEASEAVSRAGAAA
jgi:hypothetical protein